MDLTKFTSDNIQQIDKQTMTRANAKKPTLAQMKANKLPSQPRKSLSIVVGDISSSMHGDKIEALRATYRKVWRPGVEGIVFNDEVYQIEESDIDHLQPNGTTQMLSALKAAWSLNARHIVLITDGQADEPDDRIFFAATSHRDVPIDCIGISSRSSHSAGYDREFLKELARITGGKFMDVGDPLELSMVVEELLQLQMGNAQLDKGVIQL